MIAPHTPNVTREGRIHWLTAIPSHWQVVPSKWLFMESKQRAQEGDQQLSATQAYGVISQAEFERLEGRQVVHSFLHLDKRKHVELDDFVISMRSFQGGLERAWDTGCIRSSYVVLRSSAEVHPAFFGHLFKSTAYIQALQATSNFIRDGQDLNWNNFTLVNLPRVPLAEQRAIADFLDRRTAAIDALISKKERLLELLAEQRAALIHRAVTRGLDPGVEMKDSGVEWIGEVPAHWEVKRMKFACRLESGHTPSRSEPSYWIEEECTIPWVSLNDTQTLKANDYISDTHYKISERGMANSSARLVDAGAVVFTRDATIGLTAITAKRMAVSQHIIAWVCRPELDNRFLLRVIGGMTRELERLTFGATIKTIGMADVKELVTPLPPSEEQRSIVAWLGDRLEALDRSDQAVRDQLDRLREYRQALITAAVTGQLDLSAEAAA